VPVDWMVAIAVAALVPPWVGVGLLGRQRRQHAAVRRDAELLPLIPMDSAQRQRLLDEVDRQLAALLDDRLERRNWRHVAEGLSLLALSGIGVASLLLSDLSAWAKIAAMPLYVLTGNLSVLVISSGRRRARRDGDGYPDLTGTAGLLRLRTLFGLGRPRP
jgi:hypothetical protein